LGACFVGPYRGGLKFAVHLAASLAALGRHAHNAPRQVPLTAAGGGTLRRAAFRRRVRST